MANQKFNRILKWLFKLVISSVALYLVFRKLEVGDMITLFGKIELPFIIAAFLLFNLSQIIGAIRYGVFLRIININLSLINNIKLYYLGMFYNLFLPGGIGGDGYKVWILKKEFNESWKTLVTLSLLVRINGMAALATLALLLFAVIQTNTFLYFSPYTTLVIAILIFPGWYFFLWYAFKRYTRSYIKVSIQSLLVQLIQLSCAYFILASLGLEENYLVYFFLFYAGNILSVLPVTIGGIGAREMTFLFGSNFFDIDTGLGVAFSLSFFLIAAFSSVFGILFDISKVDLTAVEAT